MASLIPISTLFIGLHGLIALALSYLVVMERISTRIWHGASQSDVSNQPDYLEKPSKWAAFVEGYTQKSVAPKTGDDGLLQRKVRAYGNFVEHVPLALLFILALELMQAEAWLVWMLGITLSVARIAHAWGLIKTYGPSPGRAIGFFLTWFVYLVGAGACIYMALLALSQG
ncbi:MULTISPECIES: MAPEG family protein [Cyanophyceae]|uniref:MAPEG family protein n=1 Tax=Leptolyngbya subtilissima DQ-A4 TaxID=2933933 RepID=A0ABV0K6W3_9CYAN|nr:MAPEG family protein [Nodosilinea sp. FACHB-141]MBD2113832.1 MAPEG family protein [Nodosilinea sp. FACHB-141]